MKISWFPPGTLSAPLRARHIYWYDSGDPQYGVARGETAIGRKVTGYGYIAQTGVSIEVSPLRQGDIRDPRCSTVS
ncbi:MAG: hypothetical protein QMC89_03845 [Candidatus Hodarchaeaceae archaeon]|nr:hypothetical protein [Candidatus Hodarchaeaceae archaeon]